MQAREALQCHKQSLEGHSGGSAQDQNVRRVDSKDCADEGEDGSEDPMLRQTELG